MLPSNTFTSDCCSNDIMLDVGKPAKIPRAALHSSSSLQELLRLPLLPPSGRNCATHKNPTAASIDGALLAACKSPRPTKCILLLAMGLSSLLLLLGYAVVGAMSASP